MGKPATSKNLERMWQNMKKYLVETVLPLNVPPDLYFDSETSTLYCKPTVGYDFIVKDAILYYKKKG